MNMKAIDTRLKNLEAKSRPMEGRSLDDFDLSRLTEEERAAWHKSRAICEDDAFPSFDAMMTNSVQLSDEQRQALRTLNELLLFLEEEAAR